MRLKIEGTRKRLWLSARETWDWANRHNLRWPCSTLAGAHLYAEFLEGNLVDYALDGHHSMELTAAEFDSITDDALTGRL